MNFFPPSVSLSGGMDRVGFSEAGFSEDASTESPVKLEPL